MKTINPETAVIVFDLDDTLYSEYEYKLSGIRAIVDTVATLYPDWDSDDLWRSIDPDGKDWLDKLCRHCGFNESEKQVLLWQYRLHRPTLTPYASPDFLSDLTAPFAARALITDGRSLTQRLKLETLGLSSLFDDILVSEACASEKPDGKRFRYLQDKYAEKADCFIYIGDNLSKDFIAPNALGWITIGLHPSEHNIHHHLPENFNKEHHPDAWISSLQDLAQLIAPSDCSTKSHIS